MTVTTEKPVPEQRRHAMQVRKRNGETESVDVNKIVRAVEARGNPVGSRDCPAAVSGNDRRHEALSVSLGSDGQ